MNTFLTMEKNLASLLSEGKLDQAKEILKGIVAAPLSDVDRGRAIVTLTMLYVEVKNKIDQEFLADLQQTIDTIRKIGVTERKIKDAAALAKVRSELNK